MSRARAQPELEVVWKGDLYLCVPPWPDEAQLPNIAFRERRDSGLILALFAHYGPMTIRTLHTHLTDEHQTFGRDRLRRDNSLYTLVSMMRTRGTLIIYARSSAGVLYCLPPTYEKGNLKP